MTTPPEVAELIAQLTHRDGPHRERARHALVKIGRPAVPSLLEALTSKNHRLRWETCKALITIKDPRASGGLVHALEDDNMEVRWLAAEALIALHREGIVPLLEALERRPDSVYLRQGAHHVLHALEKDQMLNEETLSLLETIRSLDANVTVPVAAQRALETLRPAR